METMNCGLPNRVCEEIQNKSERRRVLRSQDLKERKKQYASPSAEKTAKHWAWINPASETGFPEVRLYREPSCSEGTSGPPAENQRKRDRGKQSPGIGRKGRERGSTVRPIDYMKQPKKKELIKEKEKDQMEKSSSQSRTTWMAKSLPKESAARLGKGPGIP